jgi:hypothetical protein
MVIPSRCCCGSCAIFEGDPDPAYPATNLSTAYNAPAFMQMVLSGNAHTSPWLNPSPPVFPATYIPHCCNDFNDVVPLYSTAYGQASTSPILFAAPVLTCPPIPIERVKCLLQWWGAFACESDTSPGTMLSTSSFARFVSTFFFKDKDNDEVWLGVGLMAWDSLPSGSGYHSVSAAAFGYLNLGVGLVDPTGGPWVVPITSPAACELNPFVDVLDARLSGSTAANMWRVNSCWDTTPGVVTVTPL